MLDFSNLRPYQNLIHNHILDVPRCGVWAGMGTGKTVSSLTAVSSLVAMGESDPVLVLAPLRVARSTWPSEAKNWAHLDGLDVMPIVGSLEERRMALKYKAQVYSINYDNLVWLIEHFGDNWPFRTVIADESTRLKNFRGGMRTSVKGKEFYQGGGGARSRALGRVAHSHIKRFIQLTGTPSPNGLIDLWGQMWFLDAGQRLGRTFESFKQRWFRSSFDGYGSEPLPTAQAEIQERLKDICLTIDPKDWFDLDEPVVNNIYLDLPPKARQLYRDMEKEMFAQIGDHSIEVFNAAARTQKLLQISSGAVYIDPTVESDSDRRAREWKEVHDVKIQALEGIIEESAGMPVFVANHFKSDLARLKKAFPKGRELRSKQDEDDWNAGKIPVLFAHPQSAGHGLNLQHGGNIIVYFSHDWNMEYRDQILERIGPVRQTQSGYKRPVFVHNLITRDTMDELVLERIQSKREVQDILLEAMKRKGYRK